MESVDKLMAIIMSGIFIVIITIAICITIPNIVAANSGLQQCVVTVNGNETLVWQKECK